MKMLNGYILCKEVTEEVTKSGIYLVEQTRQNYKKFRVFKSNSEGITEGDTVYTPPHGVIPYEEYCIISKNSIIMIE